MKKEKGGADRIIVTAPFKVKFDYKQLNLSTIYYILVKEKFNSLLKEMGRR
jgi:hypothetical protein